MAIIIASVAITACFKDPGTDILWNGLEVEFHSANLPDGLNPTFTRTSDTQEDTYEVQINLVGKPQPFPVTVNFDADASSTAVSGTHYLMPTKSVTILPGENVVKFPIKVLTGKIATTAKPDLVLKITSVTGANASVNYSKVTIKMRVICPSAISTATDNWTATSQSGFGTFTATVKVTPLTTAGQYVVSDISAGLYAAFGFSTTQEAVYSDQCNALTFVARRTAQFAISAPSVEPKVGSYNPTTKTLVLYWSDPNNGINGRTTLVKQ